MIDQKYRLTSKRQSTLGLVPIAQFGDMCFQWSRAAEGELSGWRGCVVVGASHFPLSPEIGESLARHN